MGIGDMLQAQQDAEDARRYRFMRDDDATWEYSEFVHRRLNREPGATLDSEIDELIEKQRLRSQASGGTES